MRSKKRRSARGERISASSRPAPAPAARAPRGPGAVLHLLADALLDTADIYNQTAPSKVNFVLPKDSQPSSLLLTISHMGYRFEETAEGNLVVSEIDEQTTRAWARIEPQANSAGHIVSWREHKLTPPAKPRRRSAQSLSEEYLLSLVRRRLASRH